MTQHLLQKIAVEQVRKTLDMALQNWHAYPRQDGLRYLDFHQAQLNVTSLAVLVEHPAWQQATVVSFAVNPNIGTDDATFLQLITTLQAKKEVPLIGVDFSGCCLTDVHLQFLLELPVWHSVKSMQFAGRWRGRGEGFGPQGHPFAALWSNDITDVGLERLLKSPHLTSLRNLDLSHTRLSSTGVEALWRSDLLWQLHSLRLNSCYAMKNTGIKILAELSPRHGHQHLPLRELFLEHCYLDNAGAGSLAHTHILDAVEVLDLSTDSITAVGASALATSTGLQSVRDLNLTKNTLGEDGIQALAQRTGLPKLQRLGVEETGVYTGEVEEWTDWDGSVVGSGPVRMMLGDMYKKYFLAPSCQAQNQRLVLY